MKLGKKPPKVDDKRLYFGKYATKAMPPSPLSVDWSKGRTEWGMLANDTHGDCTVAAVGHAVQLYTMNSWDVDQKLLVTDEETLGYYSKWCGYNPADPNSDQGGIEVDVLNAWRKDTFNNHVLMAYADTAASNVEHIKQGIAYFGCVYIGVALPAAAEGKDEWDVRYSSWRPRTYPGSWGGHAVIVVAYDSDGLMCITWGKPLRMTWGFWNDYCDEAHVLLHRGWYPPGFSLEQLQADLATLEN